MNFLTKVATKSLRELLDALSKLVIVNLCTNLKRSVRDKVELIYKYINVWTVFVYTLRKYKEV